MSAFVQPAGVPHLISWAVYCIVHDVQMEIHVPGLSESYPDTAWHTLQRGERLYGLTQVVDFIEQVISANQADDVESVVQWFKAKLTDFNFN